MGCFQRLGGIVVGLAVLIGSGSFALGMALLLSHGAMPAGDIFVVAVIAVVAAFVSGWLFGRVAARSWRVALLVLPLAVLLGLSLMLASYVPISQACRTYPTSTVCPPSPR